VRVPPLGRRGGVSLHPRGGGANTGDQWPPTAWRQSLNVG